jgi:hypothetical protein
MAMNEKGSYGRVETQRSTQVSDVSVDARDGDLYVNSLVYDQPKSLSLATNRTYRREFSQRNTYTGGPQTTMIWNLNTGTDYIDLENSYLIFTVTLTGAANSQVNFGSGSVTNLFNEVRIRSRSGTELDRIEDYNIWARQCALYKDSDDYLDTLGSVQGFGDTRDGATDAFEIDLGVPKKFAVPIRRLAGFFQPLDKSMLLPPQLASGLRMEISLEDYRTAFYEKVVGCTGYTITDPVFQLCCVSMTDDTQRTINMESASDGLEYAYKRVFTATNNLSAGVTNVNQQIYKAVSQAMCVTTQVIDQANKVDITVDSLASVTFPFDSWQYRLGALYFPFQEITTGSDGVESYIITQQVYDKLKHGKEKPTSVNLTRYVSDLGVIGASFEKNTNLNLSGLPVNNSRNISVDATITAQGGPVEVVSFMEYGSVAKCFIDSVAVAI